jgi:hypothetical protein
MSGSASSYPEFDDVTVPIVLCDPAEWHSPTPVRGVGCKDSLHPVQHIMSSCVCAAVWQALHMWCSVLSSFFMCMPAVALHVHACCCHGLLHQLTELSSEEKDEGHIKLCAADL